MKFHANVLPMVMVMMALEPNGFVAAKEGLSIRVIAKGVVRAGQHGRSDQHRTGRFQSCGRGGLRIRTSSIDRIWFNSMAIGHPGPASLNFEVFRQASTK
jgi:hypothetical protein